MEIIAVSTVTDQIVSHISVNSGASLSKILKEHVFNGDGDTPYHIPGEGVSVYLDGELVIFVGDTLLEVMNEILVYGDSYFGEYEDSPVEKSHPDIVVSLPVEKEVPVVPFKKESYAKEKPKSSNRGIYGRLRRKDNA